MVSFGREVHGLHPADLPPWCNSKVDAATASHHHAVRGAGRPRVQHFGLSQSGVVEEEHGD
jgi:hypothetical protein